MCNALVSVHGLKNEVYSRWRACFDSWIKERLPVILMRSTLVSE